MNETDPYGLDALKEPLRIQDYQADVEIDRNNLNEMFIRHASLAAFYGTELAKAHFQEGRIKLALEIQTAKLSKAIREELVAKGVKPTEKMVEEELKQHPSYQKFNTALLEANANVRLMAAAVEAFRHRKDMLVQLGVQQREELKGELRLSGNALPEGLRAAIARETQ